MTAPRMTWVLVNKKNKCSSQKLTSQRLNPQLMSILFLLPHLGPRLHQSTSTIGGQVTITYRIFPAKELREPAMEHLYTTGILGNTLSWGDQQIPEPVDEIVDIQEISYERKRKVVMRRNTKKRRLTLDNTLLINTEEMLFDTENAKMTELIGAGMAITDATLDRERRMKGR
jgi:hypothetical protein